MVKQLTTKLATNRRKRKRKRTRSKTFFVFTMILTAQFVRIIANRFFYVTSPTYLTFDNLFQVVSEDTSPEKQQESEEMQEKEDIKEKKEQPEKQEKKEEIVKVVKSEMALVSCIAS